MKKILCLIVSMIMILSVVPVNFADSSLAKLKIDGNVYVGGRVKADIIFNNSTIANEATVEMTDKTGNKLIYVDTHHIKDGVIKLDFQLRDWVKADEYKLSVTANKQRESFKVIVSNRPIPNDRDEQVNEPEQKQIIVREAKNESQKIKKKKFSKKQFVVAKNDVVTKQKGNRTVKSIPSHAIKAMLNQAKGENGKREIVIPVSVAGKKSFGIELSSSDLKDVKNAGLPIVIESELVMFTINTNTLEDVNGLIELDVEEISYEDGLKAFDFTMTETVEGQLNAITQFSSPMEIALDIEDIDVDHEFVRVFYVRDNGTLEFVGGHLNAEGQLVFETNHFSKYILKEEKVSFADDQPSWAKHAIEVMASQHVIDGYDGKFYPSDNVTKAQFAKLIVEAMNYQTSADITFNDVNASDWYTPYLARAVANGIIEDGGDFNPNAAISREEMAIMLGNTITYSSEITALEMETIMSEFTDVSNVSNEKNKVIAKTINEGIMGGIGDGLFDLKGYANRAQAATVIYRLFEVNK